MAGFLSRQEMLLGSLSKGAIEKRAQWEDRGDRYLRRRGVGQRLKDWVRVDPGLQQQAADRMSRLAPALGRAFTRRLVPVAEHAQASWPVKSGLSRALLSLVFLERGPGRFAAELTNPAPYAHLINGGDTADELVFGPGRRAMELIADDVAKEF